MRFLRPQEIQSCDVLRTFRHSAFTALFMCAWFVAPMVLLAWGWESVLRAARLLPWPAWFVAAPLALLLGAVVLLCLSATRDIVVASFLASNWLVKTTRDGIHVQLRSYQNHHFPLDVPTVAFFAFSEIAGVRRVDESFESGLDKDGSTMKKRWIEIALTGVDTAPLESWLKAERTRPAPTTRTIGVRSSTRFNHAPVVVPRPGVVYIEWMGRSMLQALAEHVPTSERKEIALDAPSERSLETRLDELIARGEPLAALALAREERKLSLTEAKGIPEEPIDPVSWMVDEIVLVCSEVGATKYERLGSWKLGG